MIDDLAQAARVGQGPRRARGGMARTGGGVGGQV